TWSTVASLPQAVSNLAASTPFMAQWSITPSALSVGAHTITANATDTAANTSPNSAPITVTVNTPPDVTPPTIHITSPVNATTITTNSITISGTASDNVAVASVQVSIDGSTYSPANGTTFWSFTKHGLGNGVHTILAKATDNAGNNAFSYGSNTIVASTIAAGIPARNIAYDSANGNFYVTNGFTVGSSVSIINGATNTNTGFI
ncbi:MAG: hypothetical protein KGI28_10320, partial [Thaumarchaeota archaeon]|nr:hypothetical protein [Nitrososphaerota archaeon]